MAASRLDAAVVGGALGGAAVALLLLVGGVVFCVCRGRARSEAAADSEKTGHELRQSDYGVVRLRTVAANDYEIGNVGTATRGSGIQVKQTGVGTDYGSM